MTLIKTSIFSALATIIQIINSFVVVKIISIYAGPSGLAYIGQFQNFISIVMSSSVGIIKSGVVKYTAEHVKNENEYQKIWSTALRISLVVTIIISLVLMIFNNYLSNLFFKTNEYESIFSIFSLTLIFFVLNTFLLAILNGKKEIKKLIIINITTN